MSSYSDPNQPLVQLVTNDATNAEQQLKLYQAFIFSSPICFTLIVLFIFYVIYLRRRRNNVDWSSLEMHGGSFNSLSMIELGLRKELREMLPIVIFGESFTFKDSQCSVCLGDYEAGEELQQIPTCGHTFHMECIDTWLTLHITCPLCRVCLIPRVPQDQSHQILDIVPSMENSSEGALMIVHIDDGRKSIGTSDGCCNCRLS